MIEVAACDAVVERAVKRTEIESDRFRSRSVAITKPTEWFECKQSRTKPLCRRYRKTASQHMQPATLESTGETGVTKKHSQIKCMSQHLKMRKVKRKMKLKKIKIKKKQLISSFLRMYRSDSL